MNSKIWLVIFHSYVGQQLKLISFGLEGTNQIACIESRAVRFLYVPRNHGSYALMLLMDAGTDVPRKPMETQFASLIVGFSPHHMRERQRFLWLNARVAANYLLFPPASFMGLKQTYYQGRIWRRPQDQDTGLVGHMAMGQY